jgi:hypothetical protein
LPLDDCLYALQNSIPHLTRSGLHRLFQRHDISRRPDLKAKATPPRGGVVVFRGAFIDDPEEAPRPLSVGAKTSWIWSEMGILQSNGKLTSTSASAAIA